MKKNFDKFSTWIIVIAAIFFLYRKLPEIQRHWKVEGTSAPQIVVIPFSLEI